MIGPAGFSQAPNTGVGSRASEPAFRWEWVPLQPRCRWFVQRGATTKFERGFRSKQEASNWINSLGSALIWRAGFTFRLRGDDIDMYIVNRVGQLATTN